MKRIPDSWKKSCRWLILHQEHSDLMASQTRQIFVYWHQLACFSQDHAFWNWSSRFRYSTSCMFWYNIQVTQHLKPHFLCKCLLLNGYQSAWTRSARKHVERIDLHELNSKPLQSMAVATLMISIPQNTIDHGRSYVKGVRKIPKMETR